MASVWRTAEEGIIDDDVDLLLEEQEAGENARDSILFLIDCSPSMFQVHNGEVPWVSAVKCASATMKNKIISSEDDLIGVIFYNTFKGRNQANFKGIYMLQKLDVPDAERILELDGMSRDFSTFQASIGSAKEEAIMGNVFWSCSSALIGKRKAGSKRVFLFTNDDSPHADNLAMQRAAKIRARDLSDLGIFVELFNLDKEGEKFDPSNFYLDILPIPIDEEDTDGLSVAQSADSSEKFAELMTKVRRRESRKRALGKMPMTLGDDMALSIRIYSLYMEAKKGNYVWMEESTGKLAQAQTEWIGQSTGAVISRAELDYYYDFGGAKAVFTKSELTSVNDLGEPGLKILGFRPRGWLKTHYNVAHSTFIFPDEAATRGSIVAFTALLEGMLELGQLAIGAYVARRTVAPKLVALLPQAEQTDPETGAQSRPAGMNLIVLPFAENIRRLPHDGELEPADSELVDKAKSIIAKLTISHGFDPEAFQNPALQRHYTSLQALALDQEIDEEDLKDDVMPDGARMQKRAGALIEEFNSMLPEPIHDSKNTTSYKRSVDDNNSPRKTAVVPASQIEGIATDAAKLSKLTVPSLKAFADSKNLKPAKLKSDLVAQIVCYETETRAGDRRIVALKQTEVDNSFTEGQLQEFREAFSLFDGDVDGKLEGSDLGSFLRALGRNPTEALLRSLVADFGGNSLTFPDCLTILAKVPAVDPVQLEKELRAAFRVFDKDGSGRISSAELKHIVTSLGERMSEREAEEMLETADPEGKGYVDYDRFIQTIISA